MGITCKKPVVNKHRKAPNGDTVKKPTVYIETSFISYVTSRLSNDYLVSAHQRVSRDWWERRRNFFNLCISQLVIDEISAGDKEESSKRNQLVIGLRELRATPEALNLAKSFIEQGALPKKAFDDALHMALAAVNGMDYLLTWNCKHIANVEVIHVIVEVCEESEYKPPLICTPLEIGGASDD